LVNISNGMKKLLTLCLLHQHPRILLGLKKRGFGAGRWNGFGGKLQPGETIEQAAKREFLEEADIKVGDIEKVGLIDFEFEGNPEILEVHIFRAKDFTGEPKETEEMKPQWFHIDEIPLDKMWSDDKYWLPVFLAGKKFKGNFLFGKGDVVLSHQLEEVAEV